MKINLFFIAKKEELDFDGKIDEYVVASSKWAKISESNKHNKEIAKTTDIAQSQALYSKAFEGCLKNFNIALDPLGDVMDSHQFAKLLQNKQEINFFIGGAFGLEKSFLNSCQKVISLSPLTMSHQIARLVLYEQLFRGLSINHNHPYHK